MFQNLSWNVFHCYMLLFLEAETWSCFAILAVMQIEFKKNKKERKKAGVKIVCF